jgi:hypothetical protein
VRATRFTIQTERIDKCRFPPFSGNPVHCYYCPNCTSHIYHHQTKFGRKYVIRTALLDGSKDWGVSAEVYAKNTAKWQPRIADEDSEFQILPPS